MKIFSLKKYGFFWLMIILSAPWLHAAEPTMPVQFNGASPVQWSVRMADLEMARRGDSLTWKDGGKAKWDYTAGLFTLALLKLNESAPDGRYVAFATNAIGSFISMDGKIHGYKVEEYQLDALNSGKTALELWRLTQDACYEKCARRLRRQLDSQPRTSAGGFWHKQRYPNQMWLDGLYMGAPFYAECAKVFNTPKDFDDVAKQFSLIDQHLYDAKSGLFYHGWDSAKVQSWANPATGASSNFWGRAGGWYAMACVDVLDFLPTNHPARKEIIAELKKVSAGIVKWQDADTGLWWQVMDQGKRDGNYLEATASAMFVYALAKGVNHGYLARDYVPAIIKGYNGIITQLIKTAGDKISLTQCCSVAGLGSSQPGGKNRDGSFNYYVGEPIVENDLKGVGPFILAGIEVQQLVGSPAQPGTVEPAGNTNWISLFDGGDLGGWVKMNGGTFTATNGILHLEGGRGWLRTEKEFGDFVLEAEWRGWETNYNSGFFLRAPLDGNPWATNIWQVNTKQSAIGELLQGAARTVKSVTPPVPTGEWVAFRIEARGTNLSLDVNGQRAWEFHGLEPARGFIGLQAEGRFFDFRNLRITEVAAGQAQ